MSIVRCSVFERPRRRNAHRARISPPPRCTAPVLHPHPNQFGLSCGTMDRCTASNFRYRRGPVYDDQCTSGRSVELTAGSAQYCPSTTQCDARCLLHVPELLTTTTRTIILLPRRAFRSS